MACGHVKARSEQEFTLRSVILRIFIVAFHFPYVLNSLPLSRGFLNGASTPYLILFLFLCRRGGDGAGTRLVPVVMGPGRRLCTMRPLMAGGLTPGGVGGRRQGRGGQANAAPSRWKPSAIWVAQRQERSMRRQVRRAERVSWAATCRTR